YLGLKWIRPADDSKLIFHQTNGGWQQLPRPAGYPETLRVSRGGAVWLRTVGGGLSRWDGAAWQRFKETNLKSKTNWMYAGLALDVEEVWAPTEEGVLHWDGKRWQSCREVPTSEGASIAAGGGEVWVIDSTGNFSHFKEGRWQSQKLALDGVNWT